MKKIVIGYFLVAVVGLFFGYLLGRSGPVNVVPLQSSSVTDSTASLMIDYGDGVVKTYADIVVVPGQDLLTLMAEQAKIAKLELETKDYGGLGKLITRIGHKKGGDEGKYWQFWVNNTSISHSADTYIVKPGDVIEWKFINYKN